MRGADHQQSQMFGYLSPERVFTFSCAVYNLVRMRNLNRAAVQPR